MISSQDGDDNIMYSVQADVNSLFPEEMPLYEWLDREEVWEIIGKFDDLIKSDDDDDDDDSDNDEYNDYDPDYLVRAEDLSLEDNTERDIIEKIHVYRYISTTKKWELIENDEMKKELFDHFCSAIRHGALESGTKNRITINDRGIVRNEYTFYSYWSDHELQSTFDDDLEYEIPEEKL